ncbi:MAG: methylated-DNA--[protein]-cysteine S-methyltransferase [Deltaproteobacteria bacterium]|nr:methylated-DNA--[protein]-cysteine S-methyltransferase [Deltaproteobacteria bacterium]
MFHELDISSPLGVLRLSEQNRKLTSLSFRDTKNRSEEIEFIDPAAQKNYPGELLIKAKDQLAQYFSGQRTRFELDYELKGTEFEMKAWAVLSLIPYASTISYQEQALKLGNKNYCRAVGQANKKNPLAIIVPCHRVIGKDKSLTGYSCGTDLKDWLLCLESGRTVDHLFST